MEPIGLFFVKYITQGHENTDVLELNLTMVNSMGGLKNEVRKALNIEDKTETPYFQIEDIKRLR